MSVETGSTVDIIRREDSGPVSPALRALTDALRRRFSESLQGVAIYGSVLRDGHEDDRLFDLLAVVDGYHHAYGRWGLALLNRLLPPNVFYLQAPVDGRDARAKYAVVTLAQLDRYTQESCLQAYFWGRLAQPTRLVHARDAASAAAITASLGQAVRTFMTRTAPLLEPEQMTADELWARGIAASYATELRAERPGVGRRLLEANVERYRRITASAAAELGWPMTGGRIDVAYSPARRWRARLGWRVRRWQGRLLHVLRLAKAVFTFEGGVDYILWKIERHSGVKIEASERARRHPLLAGWPLVWKLYRHGGFR